MAFAEKRVEDLLKVYGDEIVLYQDDYEQFPQFVFLKPTVQVWSEYVNSLARESADEDAVTRTLLAKSLACDCDGLGNQEDLAKMLESFAGAGDSISVELRILATGGDVTIAEDGVTFDNAKHGKLRFRKPTPIALQRMRAALGDARKSRYQAFVQFCKDGAVAGNADEYARIDACKDDYPAFPIAVANKLQTLSAGGAPFRPGKRLSA